MKFPFEIVAKNEDETSSVAHKFADELKQGDVVLLIGNLGSGKTFFTKSICHAFRIDSASSPSFAIVNEYSGEADINHFDFYRIKKVEELYDVGFDEYINDESKINIIEWADLFPEILPSKNFEVRIEDLTNTKRKIAIFKNE